MLIKIVSAAALALSGAWVLMGPSQIGKKREPLPAWGFLVGLGQAAIMTVMAGHCLGWW